MLEQRGLIQIKWLEYGNDIEKIMYRLEQAGQFYELLGLTSKWERLETERQILCKWSEQAQTGWLRAYYEDQVASLEKGKPLWICRSTEISFHLPECPGKAGRAGLPACIQCFGTGEHQSI